MTVTEAIRALRKHSGLSQQVFATYLGISLRSLQKYEQEQIPDPPAMVRLLALATDRLTAHAAGSSQEFGIIHRTLLNTLLGQLAAPGWTIGFDLMKGDTTRQRGFSGYRTFRPATSDTEIRWRQTEATA